MLQETISMIKELVGNEPYYFEQPIKMTPWPMDTYICGVQVYTNNRLYCMDGMGDWFEVRESDYRDTQVIYLRMKEVYRTWNHPKHIEEASQIPF
jgi:hypothetical protein